LLEDALFVTFPLINIQRRVFCGPCSVFLISL